MVELCENLKQKRLSAWSSKPLLFLGLQGVKSKPLMLNWTVVWPENPRKTVFRSEKIEYVVCGLTFNSLIVFYTFTRPRVDTWNFSSQCSGMYCSHWNWAWQKQPGLMNPPKYNFYRPQIASFVCRFIKWNNTLQFVATYTSPVTSFGT